MHDFKKMKVWQKARELTKKVYLMSEKYPYKEVFGLTSLIRRTAISVISNIAEGSGRNTDGEFSNFLGIAYGSSCELEAQVIISSDLGYITISEAELIHEEINEVQKMLHTLIQKFKKNK